MTIKTIVVDLDATLIGDDATMINFFEIVKNLRTNGSLKLVYATGRNYRNYLKLKDEKNLLNPDALISGVGTELIVDNKVNEDWAKLLTSEWDKQEARRIQNLLADYELQSEDYQNTSRIALQAKFPQATNNTANSYKLNIIVSHDENYYRYNAKKRRQGKGTYIFA